LIVILLEAKKDDNQNTLLMITKTQKVY